jgi:hypothetical protein
VIFGLHLSGWGVSMLDSLDLKYLARLRDFGNAQENLSTLAFSFTSHVQDTS